ncbi:MAG: DUF6077 domain-containing protein [Candidatus Binatia bacterium]
MNGLELNGSDQPPERASPSLSELCCDWACIVFALWTLCCHLTVALGGTFQQLLALSALTMSVGIVLLVKWQGWRLSPPIIALAESSEQTTRRAYFDLFQKVSVPIGLTGFTIAYQFGDIITVWWWISIMLAVAATVIVWDSSAPVFPPPHHNRLKESSLWLIACACAVLALICHRPDADDAFYINLAVTSVDFPHQPLLVFDTLHGVPNLPIYLSAYLVHSYELWNGALSYLTGLPPIYCFHWVSTALAAFFVPFAYANLFRVLMPKRWLWGVITIVFLFIAVGETHRWYGNFAFVRIWQGKSIFLSVFLPLIYASALKFTQYPTLPRWLLLAAVQIAAVGCSSSALWAAPCAALMTLGSMFHPTRKGLRIALVGSLASAYILSLGLIIKGQVKSPNIPQTASSQTTFLDKAFMAVQGESHLWMFSLATLFLALGGIVYFSRERRRSVLLGVGISGCILSLGWFVKELSKRPDAPKVVTEQVISFYGTLTTVLGGSYVLLFGLVSLLIAWACCPRGVAQRFAIGSSLIAMPVLLNPYTCQWIAANVTGPSYWRSFWGIPLPILMTFVLMAPLQMTQHAWQRMGGRFVYLITLAAFATFVPKYSGLSPQNGVQIHLPELKTPHLEYRWAAKVNHSVPPGSFVVTPPTISTWIPTFHHHAYPLKVRNYLTLRRSYFAPKNIRARAFMTHYVAGVKAIKKVKGVKKMKDSPNASARFASGLEQFNITGVCLQQSRGIEEARMVLQEKGFHRVDQDEKYELWIR